jgi:hypothetical protein
MKAPIYYDSNNTAYYGDFASTSYMLDAYFGDGVNGDQGIRIRYGNNASGYGRIRFHQDGANHSTIHSFSNSWQNGNLQNASSGAINITGNTGVTFGDWNNVDMWVNKSGAVGIRTSLQVPYALFTNDGASRVMYIRGTGNIIQFQDAAANNKWEVVGRDGQFYVYKNDGTGQGYIWQVATNGTQTFYTASTFNSTVTATGFFESSDARLKTIVDENYRVDSIVSIKPKFYEKNGKFEAGYIAQEVDKIYSHAVIVGDDGYLSLSYGQIHTLKIAALEDSVDEIKKKIQELEQKLNTLY